MTSSRSDVRCREGLTAGPHEAVEIQCRGNQSAMLDFATLDELALYDVSDIQFCHQVPSPVRLRTKASTVPAHVNRSSSPPRKSE